ncbi:RecBCD enzyme subunit RecD [Neolewinella maritima]|uniref:RecBCD enzyme subunit RecD n=1 Tax=Neolewinella maritima TaxID=1383882 RepID=A0ABM9B4C8_9BACT|nr:AAA domain-containing protein [Neolewinella maritima]CAH1002188.1 RecBCD enzyme subunit RecD [Neolewinella maritima]
MDISPRNQAISDYFYRRTRQLTDSTELAPAQQVDALRRLILELFERATEEDELHFSTLYARITYAAHKYKLPRELTVQERQFRRARGKQHTDEELTILITAGCKLAVELNHQLFGTDVPTELAPLRQYTFPAYRPAEIQKTYYQLRVLALEVDRKEKLLWVGVENRSEQVYAIPYGDPELADSHIPQAVQIIEKISGPYLILNLLRAQVHDDGRMYPAQIVIEPDYLVNVTDVANCFSNGPDFQPWTSIPKRLLPFEKRPPLVRGNIVNSFLDVLIHDPDASFAKIKATVFEMQPLELCLFDDREVSKLMQELKHHFVTVQKFVRELLPELRIDRETVLLEPSFLSPAYGLQGRLDLLQSQRDTEDATTSIVELKTSKIFAPNRHGIRSDNFIQTLLYDLMINQALGRGANVRSYILYSVDYAKPVRYAPPEWNRQLEAISARNQLVGVEMLIAQLGTSDDLLQQTDALFSKLHPQRFKHLGSFTEQDHRITLATYEELDGLERRYLGAFMGFVAREQRLSKIGEQKTDHINGLASLWLDERQDKIDRFELLDGLTFDHYDVKENVLTLQRRADDSQLIKFRQGDVIALYGTPTAKTKAGDAVRGQIFKSTIIAVDPQTVHLRPRNPQLNDGVFLRKPYWSIEKDVLDSGFKNHYLGLYLWAAADKQLRKKWLGLLPPQDAPPHPLPVSDRLTEEQDRILRKVITAPDYFLLWGPPGTGKTSQMLHYLVDHLLKNTQENVLLVAYTNRAVDEICESIERIEIDGAPYKDYLRIGSRLGTAADYSDRLLQVRSKGARSRRELRRLIDECRVVVGTVASVGGKNELFKLKSFDRIVVDEASQILEPLLGGILTRAPRALLIGDHRQLPAVVQQGAATTRVNDDDLRAAGLTDLSTSLFERLYLTAKRNEWTWAYDQLQQQGRMHREIMAFPALHFYQGKLNILPESISHHLAQLAPLDLGEPQGDLQDQLCAQRLVFFPTEVDGSTPDPKVNRHEAELLVKLVEAFTLLYQNTDRPIKAGDIGIITPYRAQIAYIRQQLTREGYAADAYTVDTVERYQGSAKRIVLMSLCANDSSQLERLSQLSDEGVDRKLNVAMTRAREHLVLVGCPDVLRQSEVYDRLLTHVAAQPQRLPLVS